MFRLGLLSLCGILVAIAVSTGTPPEDPKFNNALSVQSAMVRARTLLSEMQAQKAVDALEEQLPKVNGNPQYLSLLRDAYRANVRDLHLTGQPALAQRYLDRLCILDPDAAKDPTLKAPVEVPPRKFEPVPVQEKKLAFPTWKIPNLFTRKTEADLGPTPKGTARGTSTNDAIIEDPFEPSNRRVMPADTKKQEAVQALLTRGAGEFKLARYGEARQLFEQAYQADRSCFDACKEQWAYCIIKGVAETMEQPGVLPGRLQELQKQVDKAVQMAPTKMMAVGQQLLETMEQRSKAGATPAIAVATSRVQHLGPNKEGWQVARTQHFLIFHKQNNEFAERAGQVAESTRATMYRKWFDTDAAAWHAECELILHPSSNSYSQLTGVPSSSPGHSRIESDPSGRIIARRMDLRHDMPGMMDAVLPHEATHVVLAGMFGTAHVPRWADEGIAVLSEPNEKIDAHRRNLLKNHKDGHLFGLKELMELKDYPHPRRIGAFYAQSVVLVEFLTQQRSPKTFTEFVKDGMRHGYDAALQKHYNMTFTQLEQLWQQQVINNTERYAARQ